MRPPQAAPASPIAKRLWLAVGVFVTVAVACGAFVLFAWTVNEEHFERPSEEFDAFTRQVDTLPGVSDVSAERWVEAPSFASPTSMILLTVERAGLPALIEAACATDYPDPVTWSLTVRTPARTEVTLNTTAGAGGSRCPDFGFDAVPLVDELDRVAPGLAVQPAVWEDGRFALVEMQLEPAEEAGYAHLLPLVAHSDDLRDAAGFAADWSSNINANSLDVTIAAGEQDRYLSLLTELRDEHGVTDFWADGAGTPADGVENVQLTAPEREHAAIERLLRGSGLHIAEFAVRFLPT